MKIFPSVFASIKNKPIDAKPIWVLHITINSVDYWLSGKAITIPAFTGSSPWPASTVINTRAMVKSWGTIQCGVTNWLTEFSVSEFSVSLILNKDALDLEALLLTYPIEDQPIELYEWFVGCTDPPQRIFHGYVRDVDNMTDTTVNLSIQDDTIKLENSYIGTKISTSSDDATETNVSVFPEADPDDVGKLLPIIYNSVSKIPPPCIKAGVATTLKYAVDDTSTTFWLSNMSQHGEINYVGMVFLIDNEFVVCTGFTTGYDNDTITVVRASILASGAVDRGTYNADTPYNLGDIVLFGNEGYTYQSIIPNNLAHSPDVKKNNQYWAYVSAVSHQQGAVIYQWSYTDPLVWLFDCPLTSIPKVYSRIDDTDVDITHLVTRYLGTSDNQLSDYPGRAAITITNVPAVSKEVAIDYSNTLSVAQGSHQHPGTAATTIVSPNQWEYTSGPSGQTGTTYSPTSNWTSSVGGPQNLYDGSEYSFAYLGLGGNTSSGYVVRLSLSTYSGSGTPLNVRGVFKIRRTSGTSGYYRVVVGGTAYAWTAFGSGSDSGTVTINSGWYSMTAWSTLYASNTYIEVYVPQVYPISGTVSFKGVYSSSSNYAVNDVVSYSGTDYKAKLASTSSDPKVPTNTSYWEHMTSASNRLYEVSYEVETGSASTYAAAAGVQLEGSLFLSGNSVADIRIGKLLVDCTRTITNDGICNDFLSRGGLPSLTISNVGTPAAYTLSGAITEYQTALWWLNYVALQRQAWFAIIGGAAKMINRPRATVDKIIPACRLDSDGRRVLTRKKTELTEVINKINLLYNRDWAQDKSDTAYRSTRLVQDSTSQGIYGLQEQSSTFKFDFITLDGDAAGLCAFYLSNYKDRHWIAEFDVFLDHSEIEFGDYVQLDFLGGVRGTVLSASHSPGSTTEMDVITLTVLI